MPQPPKPKTPKIAKLNRWKVLGVAWRHHNLPLAMQAVGLGNVVKGIQALYQPQTTAALKQISTAKRKGYRFR